MSAWLFTLTVIAALGSAVVAAARAGAAAPRTSYVNRWTAGNHVRVLAGLAAAAAVTLALVA